MTVLNVEYFGRFSMLHEGNQFFIGVVMLIAIVIAASLLVFGFEDHDKKCTECGMLLLVITFFVLICIGKAYITKTDYISKRPKCYAPSIPAMKYLNKRKSNLT